MPRTEVTQCARERTRVILPQDPAHCSRQEKWRGWGDCSLIISLDKSTSRRREKKTAKSILDHSHDTTLSAQDSGLSGKLRSALNLCCLSRRTQKSEWHNSNVTTQCTNQSQKMKNRKIWEEPLYMRLERGAGGGEVRCPNTAQSPGTVSSCSSPFEVHKYKCWDYVQTAGAKSGLSLPKKYHSVQYVRILTHGCLTFVPNRLKAQSFYIKIK